MTRFTKDFNNRVIVKEKEDFGVINSNTEYFLDGIIDMGATSIEIPAGGIYISGYNFDLSGLISTENNYTLFTSPVGGSGNILFDNFYMEVSGTTSKVYDIEGLTGFEAIEVDKINWNNCTSLGTIFNYRQGLETGTGRFGGTPELTLDGVWVGGYFIETSIVRSLTDGAYSLYKAGGTFLMSSRFRSNQNLDLNATVSFFDFSPSNFVNPSTIQLDGCLVSRNGAINSGDTTLIPNITEKSLASSWKNNIGLPNTFIGGTLTLSSEAATTVTFAGTFYDLAGTWAASDLQHFDSPSSGQLRHIGDSPIEFVIQIQGTLETTANDEVELKIVVWDDSASTFVDYKTVTRTINNVVGSRDIAYYAVTSPLVLDTNDYVKLQVANVGATNDITAEITTEFLVQER